MVFLRVPSCPLWFPVRGGALIKRSINHEGREGTRTSKLWNASDSAENFFRSNHRVAVNCDRVFHATRVPTSEGHHHWSVTRFGYAEHQFIPPLESFDGKGQSAELIFTIRVGPRNVTN